MLRIMLVLAVCANVGYAQRMLAPDQFNVDVGEAVALSVAPLEGPADAWPAERVELFCVTLGGARHNRQSFPEAGAETPSWTMQRAGVAVVGLDLKPRVVLMNDAELRAVGDVAPDEGGDPVSVRRVESFKALVRVGDAPVPSGPALEKIGLAVEIRPHSDPTATTPGHDFFLRAYVLGASAVGVRVHARNLDTGDTASCITDREGIGHVRISRPGRWAVWFQDMREVNGQLTLFSSTLTFQSPPGEKP